MSSIVIADSHSVCRQALCDYIRQADTDMKVYEAGHYTQLCAIISAANPDLVIMERDLRGCTAQEYLIFKDIRLALLLPCHNGEMKIDQACNINGVFHKGASCKEFLVGIREILEGRRYFPVLEEKSGRVFAHAGKPGMDDYHLTAREQEVIYHLMRGASNKDIARALDLQVVTVKLHVRGICRKLNAANRTQAALLAQENGWTGHG